MNDQAQLQASMWVMVVLQTLGSFDPLHGPRKLPAPKVFVAVVIVWSCLGLLADAGASRAATVMGWVTVLTGLVVGPFGTRLVALFGAIADRFGTASSTAPSQQGTTLA